MKIWQNSPRTLQIEEGLLKPELCSGLCLSNPTVIYLFSKKVDFSSFKSKMTIGLGGRKLRAKLPNVKIKSYEEQVNRVMSSVKT